jgi:hypothetical protein
VPPREGLGPASTKSDGFTGYSSARGPDHRGPSRHYFETAAADAQLAVEMFTQELLG